MPGGAAGEFPEIHHPGGQSAVRSVRIKSNRNNFNMRVSNHKANDDTYINSNIKQYIIKTSRVWIHFPG
eukprot:11659142-Heterocapsa_arctica.AAC.1